MDDLAGCSIAEALARPIIERVNDERKLMIGYLREVGTFGEVVLMRHRRPEERLEAVTQELVDRSLITVDFREGQIEEALEEACLASTPRRSASAVDPTRSQKSTVICLRSPSSAVREVRIFSCGPPGQACITA